MNYLRLLQLRRGYMRPDDGAGAGGAGAPDDAGRNADPAEGEDSGNAQEESAKTFSEADVNAIVEKRLARDRKDQAALLEKARKEGRTEGQRLAEMSAEERADDERKKQAEAIAKREADITRRELRATALEELAKKGLPKGLADILTYTDAEACNASITAVEKAFRDAVQQGVEERLKGKELPKEGGGTKAQPTGKAADRVNQKINALFDQK